MDFGDERQHLLDRLLDAVKQCQVRFGGKNELATDSDSRVSCLVTQFEAIFQHGMKTSRTRVSAFRQVGKVTGIVKQDPEPVFWHLVKEHLGKLEEDRFYSLHNVTTDAGRGRSWLRSALNEQTLEYNMRNILGDKKLLSMFYEKEAFLLDEERSSMVPMMAAGLSSILFALNIDADKLNIVKQAPPPQASTKDMLSTLLPPSLPRPPADEPAPVYSGEVSQIKTEKRKKKKKIKVLSVSIEEDGNDGAHERVQPNDRDRIPAPCPGSGKISSPLTYKSFETNTSTSRHSRDNIETDNIETIPGIAGTTSKVKSIVVRQDVLFAEVSRTVSSFDSSPLYKFNDDPPNCKLDTKPGLTVHGSKQDEEKASKQDEDDEVFNFSFEALNIPRNETYLKASPGVTVKQQVYSDEMLESRQGLDNMSDCCNSNSVDFKSEKEKQCDTFECQPRSSVQNSLKEQPVKVSVTNPFNTESLGRSTGKESELEPPSSVRNSLKEQLDKIPIKNPFNTESLGLKTRQESTGISESRVFTEPSDFSAFENSITKQSTCYEALMKQGNAQTELAVSPSDRCSHHTKSPDEREYERDAEDSSSFASLHESSDTGFRPAEQSKSYAHTQLLCDSPMEYETVEIDKQTMRYTPEIGTDSPSDPIMVIGSGESLVPVVSTARQDRDSNFRDSGNSLRDSNKCFRDSCDNSPGSQAENAETSSLSSASLSWVEDGIDSSSPFKNGLDVSRGSPADLFTCGADDAVAALAACSDVQKGMSRVSSAFSTMKGTVGNGRSSEDSMKHEGMSSGELKQAMLAMMFKKDETEEENRNLRDLLDENRCEVEQLKSELEQTRTNLRLQDDKDSRKIQALSRENELLKHQLKKYVGAVQMMRRDLQGSQSRDTTDALAGIRQDEILPSLSEPKNAGQESEKVEEYKWKLIQVSEMHGELLEFNDRLHKQLNARQFQIRRLREELINLRGPLPEDSEEPDEVAQLLDFDPCVMTVNSRPLINVWIPSAFLRGRSSGIHHVYQLYARIQDDEWNVYRRYSHFYNLHKKLRLKYHIVSTFKFPPKKTIGNKDLQFVETRRRSLQEYLRRVINFLVTSEPQLAGCRDKATFLNALPFFGDPFPSDKVKPADPTKRKRGSFQYTGL